MNAVPHWFRCMVHDVLRRSTAWLWLPRIRVVLQRCEMLRIITPEQRDKLIEHFEVLN